MGCEREIDGVRYWLAILVLQSIFDANLFVQVILARFCAHSGRPYRMTAEQEAR
jgi:hypothetical protein